MTKALSEIPTVLVVEDDTRIQSTISEILNGRVGVVGAFTIGEARSLFSTTPNIAIITMDACVPGIVPNTMDLVTEFRKSFRGPIIAASFSAEFSDMLVAAGCDHRVLKENLIDKILEILAPNTRF